VCRIWHILSPLFSQDENQFSTDETEIHVSSEEQAETESGGHVTKTRRRRRKKHKTIHGIPTSQVNGTVQTEEKPPELAQSIYHNWHTFSELPFTFLHDAR
jgi:hypothetical protein